MQANGHRIVEWGFRALAAAVGLWAWTLHGELRLVQMALAERKAAIEFSQEWMVEAGTFKSLLKQLNENVAKNTAAIEAFMRRQHSEGR